ncbi:MAG TPA: acyl-ACP desaturase, partial [Acidimicrobiales bacterium]|nr:acyl-ACP desaturase [Acidimicrobiales bacterium]
IDDFPTHAARIAKAGIYDFVQHHDHILLPLVVRHWRLESLEGLSPEAEEARQRVLKHVSRVGSAAGRLRARREREAQLVDAR